MEITGVNIILLNLQKLIKIKLQTMMFLLTYIHRTVFTYLRNSDFVNLDKIHDIIILNSRKKNIN